MAFSNEEKISNADKISLQITGTANAPAGQKYWYNENFPLSFVTPPGKLWNDFDSIPGAGTPAVADVNVAANPLILEARAVRLTVDITSNNRAYLARTTYNDNSTPILDNWIQPSLIRNNGEMSPGYGIRLWNGDPNSGGTELSTTYLPGTGGAPSWQFSYSVGIIVVSTDQATAYGAIASGAGLWISGYRYIGSTGGSGSGSGSGGMLCGDNPPTMLTVPPTSNPCQYTQHGNAQLLGKVVNWMYCTHTANWYPASCCASVKHLVEKLQTADTIERVFIKNIYDVVTVIDNCLQDDGQYDMTKPTDALIGAFDIPALLVEKGVLDSTTTNDTIDVSIGINIADVVLVQDEFNKLLTLYADKPFEQLGISTQEAKHRNSVYLDGHTIGGENIFRDTTKPHYDVVSIKDVLEIVMSENQHWYVDQIKGIDNIHMLSQSPVVNGAAFNSMEIN